jgi:hypothetical protein
MSVNRVTVTLALRATRVIAGTIAVGVARIITGAALHFLARVAVSRTITIPALWSIVPVTWRRAETPGMEAFPRTSGRRAGLATCIALPRWAGWRHWRPHAVWTLPAHWWRHRFAEGQLSVAVPIKFPECVGGVIEFLVGDLSVVISVEDGE